MTRAHDKVLHEHLVGSENHAAAALGDRDALQILGGTCFSQLHHIIRTATVHVVEERLGLD